MKKVMFISSMGGHLNELLMLDKLFNKYDYKIITEKNKSTKYLKNKYKKKASYLIYCTKKTFILYPFVLILNSFISLFYFIMYRPDFVVTTGTHTAGPMCCIAHIFKKKVIYIETFANVNTKTATGKLVYKFADLFVVQWPQMLEVYPNAKCFGSIF
ncbi:MAG: polysaccharide biosynthesis protein [Firmicutes bacterium]|jgi:UDP-N-acetylglucosamine:LPS N-acetylglucosamine transferase|nr:polysaccharide biosynthesis protein [Bacillota bacterium]